MPPAVWADRWTRAWMGVGVVGGAAFLWWVLARSDYDVSVVLQFAVGGLGPGAAAALAGVGIVLTYQVTGVFNFAFGGIATLVAYVVWQLSLGWGLPLFAATAIGVVVVGPLIGIVLERAVYRPMQRRSASTSERLLATLAVFALVIGLTGLTWGLGSKPEAPQLFGSHAIHITGDFVVAESTIGQLAVVVGLVAAVAGLMRYTALGRQIRAVVDRRGLAELCGVRVNRLTAFAWALGCGFAGLAGVLYAPVQGLSPYGLTILMLETFGVAVMARLTSPLRAVVAGLVVGMVQNMALRVQPDISSSWGGLTNVQPYLFVLALPVFLLVYRDLDELGAVGQTGSGVVAAVFGQRSAARRPWRLYAAVAAVAVAAGWTLQGRSMTAAQEVLATTIVFLSIVAVTGFSGHLALGQAAFAGVGALLTTKLANGSFPGVPKLPVIVSMIVASGVVLVLGMATGFPALHRRGLILGLATLATGLVLYFLVFENYYFLYGVSNTPRPHVFGLSLVGDRAMYFYELVLALVAMAVTARLRSGRLGRVLAAMRDSEPGVAAIGLSLRRYKLFVFAVSSVMAGIGGSLLAQTAQTFDAESYSPLISLFWFLAVVFAGLSYLSGAVIAAVLYVGLDFVVARGNVSVVAIALLALLSAGMLREGGLVGSVLRLRRRGVELPSLPGLRASYDRAVAIGRAATVEPVPDAAAADGLVPTPFGRELADELTR